MESTDNVLLVDDDVAVRKVLAALLIQSGMTVTEAGDGAEALKRLSKSMFDVVVTDLRMPGLDGMGLLDEIVQKWPDIPVILITAHGTVPIAVEAMKKGASDFVLKPFDRDELLFIVRKALMSARQVAHAPDSVSSSGLLGNSPPMVSVRGLLARVAQSDSTVLLRGESGTGKELAARALHQLSPRRDKPFVALHCGALPETLLESELFGYEKGAFTGATTSKPGRVELAEGGTLFLDEIGDVSLSTQVKLLRLIQEREVVRVGGRTTLKVDVRFVAATHRPLEEMVRQSEFREDLFYRLNVVPVVMPPLRARGDDVAVLARQFVDELKVKCGRPNIGLSDSAFALLGSQAWPGNVRQLKNFIERVLVLSSSDEVSDDDIRRELQREVDLHGSPASESSREGLSARRAEVEKAALIEALEKSNDNRTVAARILGISRRTLYNKLAEHGLDTK